MHDGPHGTIKIGNKTVQTPGGGFGNPEQAGASIAPPTQASLPPSLGFQPGNLNPYQQAAQTMMQAGITGLGDTNKDRREERERLNQSIPGAGEGILTVTPGAGQGTDGSGQGTDSSGAGDDGEGLDDIIFKVLTGPEINKLDSFQMRRVKSILDNYIKLGETNPLKLRALMTGNIAGGIFGKDQSFSDMEGNIIDEEDIVFKDGQMFTKDGKPIRRTKEGTIDLLKEEIGSEGIQSLKMFNPEMYYPFMGMPATSGSLVDLAKIPVTPEMQGTNPELAQMIFNARMELDRMGKNPMTGESQGGGQGGISNISIPTSPGPTTGPVIPNQYGAFIGKPGPFIADFVDSDGDGVDDRFQTGPGQPSSQTFVNPKAPLPGTSGIAQAVGVPAALNYANIAPQFTGYTNQGVSPMLGDYYGNLRRFYG